MKRIFNKNTLLLIVLIVNFMNCYTTGEGNSDDNIKLTSTSSVSTTSAPSELVEVTNNSSVSNFNPWIPCSEYEGSNGCPEIASTRKYCALKAECREENEKNCYEDVDDACSACTSNKGFASVHEKYTCDEFFSNNLVDPKPDIGIPEPIDFDFDYFYMRTLCTDAIKNGECGSDDKKVCGFKSGCDPKYEACFKEFNNKCSACSDSTIMEFTNYECPKSEGCPSTKPEFCTMEWSGVCAKKKDCNKDNSNESCFETHGTVCQACSAKDSNFEIIYDKNCYDLQPVHESCEGFTDSSCVDDYDYGLDYSIGEPLILEETENLVDPAIDQVKELSTADIDATVSTVNNISSGSTGSNDSDRAPQEPSIAIDPPFNYKPSVCGVKKNCNSDCERTYKDKCDACKNSDIGFIKRQGCSFAMTSITSTSGGSPEIAYLDTPTVDLDLNDGGAVNEEFLQEKTADLAAQNGLSVLRFYNAERCTNAERNSTCTNSTQKVCGYRKCDSGNCPYEYNGKCNACRDSNVEFVVNERCSDVGSTRVRISCSSQERADTCKNTNGLLVDTNVCGETTTTTACINDDCRKKYSNNCEACADATVNYYYEGECNNSSKRMMTSILSLMILIIVSVLLN